MFDLVKRQPYTDLFDFEKFHKSFQQQLETADGSESFTMKEFISNHPELWKDYDLLKAKGLPLILENEVYSAYRILTDIDGRLIFPPKIKNDDIIKSKEPKIRDLVKEFLEKEEKPQSPESILEYVNQHRIHKTDINSLRASLGASDVKDIFVYFENGKYGFHNKKYNIEDTQNRIKFPEYIERTKSTDLHSQVFELRYSSKRLYHPIDFFTKALSNSSHFDVGLGYFSSACFNVLACGFAHFIANGGQMRMYINPNLTEDDYNLLKNEDISNFKKRLVDSYEDLLKVLSKRDELFFKCLAYLIKSGRVQIKIAILKQGGIAHEKFGVFSDSFNNEVAFTGSMNLTASGLLRNIESVDCTCSWINDEAVRRIEVYHDDFNNIWDGRNNDVILFPSDDFCNVILQKYPTDNTDELLRLEKEVLTSLPKEIKLKQRDIPHFPSKFQRPFPYQYEAYNKWCERGRQGIFAMATGTGKTITSLNCALEEYYNDDYYRLIILVPSLALVEQWEEEVTNFNFKNIITVSSENITWRNSMVDIMNKIKRKDVNYVIIATYLSFVNKDFQILLPRISSGAILLADAAHNIGSKQVRQAFRSLTITRRIALSATPQRVYDEEGTKEIETFFNDEYPYTYSFSMRRAIKEERLMQYVYFPRLAHLDEDEMSQYTYYTRQLLQMYDEKKQTFSNNEKAHTLLMLRKNVLHKAKDKISVYQNIISEIGEENLKYCFVYSAAGKRTTTDGKDDDFIDEEILKQMLTITKQTFPSIRCNSYTSKDSKSLRKQKLDAFANGQIDILFAKNCLDEGVDVPRAEYGIFTSSTGNPRQFIQRRGRLLRKHKDKRFAYIYDIIVTPNFNSSLYDYKCWKMERNLVEGEIRRVANFASMASNYYTGAMDALKEVLDFYDIDLSGMVLNEE